MRDPRITRLAEILIQHSCQLQKGEVVLIEAFDLPDPRLVCELVRLATEAGGVPLVSWKNNTILRSLYLHGGSEHLALAGRIERGVMEQVQAYIGVRGAQNNSQFGDVPLDRMGLYQKLWWNPVHSEVRVPKTKWVVLRYPTPSMAQSAKMSDEAFEDFYFNVCTTDYAAMARSQEPLVKRMSETDVVRVVGPGTDLKFSIRGQAVRPCHGQRNIPDGEVFTSPLRESPQGVIRYNAPSLYQGQVFEGIEFHFEKGRIVKASAGAQTAALNRILDADEGARYIGEWSIGCNNHVRKPMLDTLFDEKIGGSMHLTPGQAYEDAENGNRSSIHWDLVLIQTPEFGGGEIYFDGHLLRKDGRFIPADLQDLNIGL